MVTRQSAILVGVGLLMGLIAAALSARLLEAMLFEVSTTDPLTYLGVAAFLCVVAGVATWVPARRATAVDPASVLRG